MSAVPKIGPLALILALLAAPSLRAADPFQEKVLPFLKTYCVRCHNQKTARGELNLQRFTTAEKLAEDFRQGEHVVTFLKKGEMPPAKAKQPSAELRADVLAALEGVLRQEARKLAGDPGVVPPRRLSNAEYDYSIADLTGRDIQPAKSFPVDPASGEGFNNTGEALTLSPSLFKKYYAAAEHVAEHALMTPSGLSFAPHPVVTFADRQKFCEQAILRFYEGHSVDHEKYFTALWRYQHRPAERKPATLDGWARENGLSAKYLRSLHQALLGEPAKDKFLLRWLRKRWKALPTGDPKNPGVPGEVQSALRSLAADVGRMSRELCPAETPAIVANAGNGPIEHLARRRKTAATRDTFDPKVISNPSFKVEFRGVTERPTVKLVVQAAGAEGTRADGYVVLRGTFTTNSGTTDGKRKWSLSDVLAKHAPEQREKLKFGSHPLGGRVDPDSIVVKVPSTLEIEIPGSAFPIKGKGNVAFTAEGRLDRSTEGVTFVRVLDRKLGREEVSRLSQPLLDPKSAAARQFELSAGSFCRLFPNRFFYVDPTRGLSAGFHLIEGFFRDDQPLCKHVLLDSERQELNRLWEAWFKTRRFRVTLEGPGGKSAQ